MPFPSKLPDIETLKRLRQQGKTLKEIAETYDVSITAVQNQLRGQDPRPRRHTYRDVVPWTVDRRFMDLSVMDRIRSIAKQANGHKLSPKEQRLLDDWFNLMANNQVVLDYHPDAPPNDASLLGGFFYRTRVPEDQHFYRDPAINKMLWARKKAADLARGTSGAVVDVEELAQKIYREN